MKTTNEEEKKQRILAQIDFEKNKILAGRDVVVNTSWDVWKKKLDETDDYNTIISYLHHGLNENMCLDKILYYSGIIKLYLNYSYGYNYYGSFLSGRKEDDEMFSFAEQGRKTSANRKSLRQEIAKKAFSVLCQKFLKDKTNGNYFLNSNYQPSWFSFLVDDDNGVLSTIIKFFSFDKNIPEKDTDSHVEKIVVDFLYKLSISAWKCNFYHKKYPPIILVKNRHHFIRFLWKIGELHFLIKNWTLLSLEDVETIRKIAYSSDSYHFSFDEPHVSNDVFRKAFLAGENIAVFYNTLASILETQLDLGPNENIRLLSVEEQIKSFQD